MLHITKPSRCTGCTACATVCPVRCISMTPDTEGFLRPAIDRNACVDCGKCARICPVNAPTQTRSQPTAWAAINRDDQTRRVSSSGGVFALLAHTMLADGGAVCAPVFDEALTVRHIVTTAPNDIARMQGSKYVQSDMGDCYAQVRTLLAAGTPVLFSGTPCQTAGLHAILDKDYPNLITQDIICHGVPSPLVWRRYLEEQSAPVRAASFRDKTHGWLRYSMRLDTDTDTVCTPRDRDPYLRLFLRDLDLRPSCHDCAFKSVGRPVDLTLADFWGVKKVMPDFSDDRGTSLLLVHTQKGEALRSRIAPALRMAEADPAAALAVNPAVAHSVACPTGRAAFFDGLPQETITQLADRLCRDSAAQKAKGLLRRVVNRLRK